MVRAATALALALLLAMPLGGALTLPAVVEEDAPRKLIRVLADTVAEPQHTPTPTAPTGIGPGANLYMDFGEGITHACTANFVWQGSNGKLYLGAAGHCFLPEDKVATHGPGADYDPSGTKVHVCINGCSFGGQSGFLFSGTLRQLGPVVYARQDGEGGPVGNDFGLVEIQSSLAHLARPSMPVWGGPTSATPAPAQGHLCHYGNGVGVGEVFLTKARIGEGAGSFDDGGWQGFLASEVGDSGSAVVTCNSDAGGWHGIRPVGIITHGVGAVVVTVPGLAFGTTTQKAIEMAREANLQISVVPGA